MRRIDRPDLPVINLLCGRQTGTGCSQCLLRHIQFALALVRLLLCDSVRLAQVQHILLRKFCVMAGLAELPMGNPGAVLPLLYRTTAVLDRSLGLREPCREQKTGKNPCSCFHA